ncbi:unnamed protein product [Cyprideis torosa]|uniref:Uncharacterized protein n=1 Tax=Cyprideis torosa TaxID=163714 RepID=A0A7R8WBY2_9CRUS|nr:unnamed protein product [Cyprideis torosa]CAG0892795.1 unnamed protein product [Cyprideis torosa]
MAVASSGKVSSRQLLTRIQEQDQLIASYEKKLSDLVRAYKTLSKERDTLADSLRVLTETRETVSTPAASSSSGSSKRPNSTPDVAKDAEQTASEGSASATPANSEQQLISLKSVVASLTEEKRKMETTFVADRKKLVSEKTRLEMDLKNKEEELKMEKTKRKKEIEDSMAQVKHLQTALTEKRSAKLRSIELPAKERLEEAQAVQAEALRREQERAAHAEAMRKQTEERLSALESEMGTLSKIVGEYERQREVDSATITRLRSDLRNLSLSSSSPGKEQRGIKSEQIADHSQCYLEIERLKMELERYEHLSSASSSMLDIVDQDSQMGSRKNSRSGFASDLSPLPSPGPGGGQADLMMGDENPLQKSLASAERRVKVLNRQIAQMEREYKDTIAFLQENLQEQKRSQKATVALLEAECKRKVAVLEEQLALQRDQTLSLLAEKERENGASTPGTVDNTGGESGVRHSPDQRQGSPTGESHMLFYAEEIALKNQQISILRREKGDAERRVRELEFSHSAQVEEMKLELERERERSTRLQNSISQEGATLQYLRNILASFLASESGTGRRQHMSNDDDDKRSYYKRDFQQILSLSNVTKWSLTGNHHALLIVAATANAGSEGDPQPSSTLETIYYGLYKEQSGKAVQISGGKRWLKKDVQRCCYFVEPSSQEEETSRKRRKLNEGSMDILERNSCLSGIRIKVVACGKDHFLLLTSTEAHVFSWGMGSRGQLGHGPPLCCEAEPRRIEWFDGMPGTRIVDVSCGGWHSLALTSSGDLYAWGWNESGQLGLGGTVNVEAVPSLVSFNEAGHVDEEPFVFMAVCGARHSAALVKAGKEDEDGVEVQLFTWGWDRYGQLGKTHPTLTAPETLRSSSPGTDGEVLDDEPIETLVRSESITLPKRTQLPSLVDRHGKNIVVHAFGWNTYVSVIS